MKFIVIRRAKWRCKSIDEQLEVLPDFLTLKQVGKLLNVSDRSLHRLLSNPLVRAELGAFKCSHLWIIRSFSGKTFSIGKKLKEG